MKNTIEITAVNGFELLFESETQRTPDQEIEITLNGEVLIISTEISVYYLEDNVIIDGMDKPEWDLESIDVDYQTAYNTENEEIVLSEEEINDIETYLEFNLKN